MNCKDAQLHRLTETDKQMDTKKKKNLKNQLCHKYWSPRY